MINILARNCIITKGYNRSLLCDLLRNKWWTIPNEVANLLENELFLDIQRDYGDFYELLKEEEILVSIPKNDESFFPKFNLEYVSPSLIEHAIIDWDESISKYNFLAVIDELENIGCRNISLRFYSDFNLQMLTRFFERIANSTIEATDIMIPFQTLKFNTDFFTALKNDHGRFKELIVHTSPNKIPTELKMYPWILFTSENIVDCSACGKISPLYFCLNIPHYTLTKNYNNCLYKKIGIDIDGQIKNCPSSSKSFGVINDKSLKEVIFSGEFKKKGLIRKDEVKVCSDCEFRSICSDCRIYLDNENDLYSRPAKCNYNPYISKWKNEESYVSLDDSGVYEKKKGLSINHEKIAVLNYQIWGE